MELAEKFVKWASEHDEDYCYDEVHEFINNLSRGALLSMMEDYAEMKGHKAVYKQREEF